MLWFISHGRHGYLQLLLCTNSSSNFKLKLLKKDLVFPYLSGQLLSVLLGLNASEAKPIKLLKAKQKHCLVFSAEAQINESLEGTPQ